MADFVELGATGVDHLTDKYFDQYYDKVQDYRSRRKAGKKENLNFRYQLPSPERDPDFDHRSKRADSLERESLTSERVLRAYENEPDDPRRKVDPRIEEKRRRDSARMSYAGGYQPDRPRSQPPRSRYYDDELSDYDEREGRRYKGSGRGYGYDDRDREERDTPYGREIIETERYRGVSPAPCTLSSEHSLISSSSLHDPTIHVGSIATSGPRTTRPTPPAPSRPTVGRTTT